MTVGFAAVACALIALDQTTKFLVASSIKLGESVPIIEGAFHITRVHNTGVAFGLFKGAFSAPVFLALAAVFMIILCVNRFGRGHIYLRTALLFILSGTIGNLIDRIRLGYVVDFIDFRIWPVFNIADIVITFGGAYLLYHILFHRA